MQQKSIAIFCGSGMGKYEDYAPVLENFAHRLSQEGYRIIFGGGQSGFMGKVYTGAAKAEKHNITGVPLFAFLNELKDKEKFDTLLLTESLGQRKDTFVDLADAFVVFPGSFGTIDEYFHVLLLNAYNVIDKPIIIVNIKEYFDLLEKLTFLPIEHGFSKPEQLKNIFSVSDVDDVLECLLKKPEKFCLYNKYLKQHKGDTK